ncbi:MAG: beta-N-acetylglucosaminidase domain-containing protein, partial [Rudaea sp.]
PTLYYGSAPFGEYLHELGSLLLPAIDVFYTGPEICSREISAADARAFGEAVCRRPIIWDNYPVNDLHMRSEMHVGPLRGRDARLAEEAKGYAAVPMIQAEASKIPLSTVADYLHDPWNYDPEASWERALEEAAGESVPFLRLFAENSLRSCLGTPETPTLEALAAAALAELERGQPVSCAAVQSFESYVVCLDEACDHLKNGMDNLALRAELLPWIELLEYWTWTGLRGLNILRALERGEPWQTEYRFMKEYAAAARDHHKRIAGRSLLPLAEYVTARVREVEEAND